MDQTRKGRAITHQNKGREIKDSERDDIGGGKKTRFKIPPQKIGYISDFLKSYFLYLGFMY